MQQEANVPELPNEIWYIIIKWLCRTVTTVRIVERSAMFVCWDWFEFTCRALSGLGMLATHDVRLQALISVRGIRGLCMKMLVNKPGMIPNGLCLRSLSIAINFPTLPRIEYMNELVKLSIGVRSAECIISDSLFDHICGLKHLRELTLRGCRFDVNVDEFKLVGLTSLRSLKLVKHAMGHELYDAISEMTWLEELTIRKPDIMVARGGWLDGMVNLKLLDVPVWCDNPAQLETLRISWYTSFPTIIRPPSCLKRLSSNAYARMILDECKSLRRLRLSNLGDLDSVLRDIEGLTSLTKLSLPGCVVIHKNMDSISRLHCLKSLDLWGTVNVHTNGMKAISRLKCLKHLSVSGVVDRDVGWLELFPGLESLRIGEPVFEQFGHILKMKNLRRLRLGRDNVVNEMGMHWISQLVWLRELYIQLSADFDSEAMCRMCSMTNLRKLTIVENECAYKPGYKYLYHLKALEYLCVKMDFITYSISVSALGRIPNLRVLKLPFHFHGGSYCWYCKRIIK
jgi:hypothetical protein